MGDVSKVLVGVAELGIRRPNDALAEWSTEQRHVGSYSAKLYKGGSGNAGSTHVQLIPPTGITLANFTTGIAAGHYSFYHHSSAVTGNFAQFEFRFEDPNSDAWAEITAVSLQGHTGAAAWVQELLLDADTCGYGGVGELGASFFNWGPLTALDSVEAAVNGEGAVDNASDWILARVRVELWEATPERTTYIDSVVVNNVTYAIEPGATTPGLSLSSPYTDVGYTKDGVTLEYTADETDIEVEEETFPIDRVITKQTIAVTCNMSESSLANIANAMAGSVLSGNILTLGDGVNKKMSLRITGVSPDGYIREIIMPLVTATGAVGMSYRKGEETIVPVTFQALKPSAGKVCTIVDNAA